MKNFNKRHVFLSHASADKNSLVLPFAKRLDENAITYWLDSAEIRWGDKIALKINDGIAKSEFVIVFLSKAFMGRNWTETELSAALSRENNEGRSLVLPIVSGDPKEILANYPLLRDKQYRKWEDGIDNLVAELSKLLFTPDEYGTTFEQVVQPDYITELEKEVAGIPEKMSNGIIFNELGNLCLIHNYNFKGIPLFTLYHIDKKQVEIVFANGETSSIDWYPNEETDAGLLKESKILLLQMRNYKPIEGFTTSLIRTKGGMMIDDKMVKRYIKQKNILSWFSKK